MNNNAAKEYRERSDSSIYDDTNISLNDISISDTDAPLNLENQEFSDSEGVHRSFSEIDGSRGAGLNANNDADTEEWIHTAPNSHDRETYSEGIFSQAQMHSGIYGITDDSGASGDTSKPGGDEDGYADC